MHVIFIVEVGQFVKQDELIANIETDKVTIPVNCPESGLLKKVFATEGDTIEVGSDLFSIDTDAKASDHPDPKPSAKAVEAKTPPPPKVSSEASSAKKPEKVEAEVSAKRPESKTAPANGSQRLERREKMSRMRIRIAERMKEAQNNAASLTTFNEVDMGVLMRLRSEFKDEFQKAHGVKLGYMSAFVRACSQALKEIPSVNARIDPASQEIVYSDFVDISVAVATPKGLVTPVLRSCESKSFAQIENEISEFGAKAREGRIALEDLAGGTFTISNGGVFGSLMGTPILNSPQSAILGMHAIKDRAVVVDGEIKIRPIMNLALTYDHRLIDGREAVSFLVRVKELLENPSKFLLL
jgi:2-oxoglutarate dehydrogenase E2 component (dihydrolipoamide succinyltransferase)